MSKQEKLAKRRDYERRPEFRERWKEYKTMHMRAYLIEHPEVAERNRQRAAQRAAELRAYAWLARIFQEPVAW